MDMTLPSSWPAVTATSRSRLQPPRAPLRRPSVAPLEVLPLFLPMSPSQLALTSSPRHLSQSASDASLEEACDDADGEECLIFALDMDGEELEEADEEPVTP